MNAVNSLLLKEVKKRSIVAGTISAFCNLPCSLSSCENKHNLQISWNRLSILIHKIINSNEIRNWTTVLDHQTLSPFSQLIEKLDGKRRQTDRLIDGQIYTRAQYHETCVKREVSIFPRRISVTFQEERLVLECERNAMGKG